MDRILALGWRYAARTADAGALRLRVLPRPFGVHGLRAVLADLAAPEQRAA